MGHQGWKGGAAGPVPQGFVPKIISGQPFPVWFWTSFASGTVLPMQAPKRSPSLHVRVPEEYAWSGRSRHSPGRGGACCAMLPSASRRAVLSPAMHIGIHICMHVYMYLHRGICALGTPETLSAFVSGKVPRLVGGEWLPGAGTVSLPYKVGQWKPPCGGGCAPPVLMETQGKIEVA